MTASVVNGDGKPKSPDSRPDQDPRRVRACGGAERTRPLAKSLAMSNAAAYDHEDAKAALEQCVKRFPGH